MRLLSVAGALAVAACQPMYKAPAAKLHEPAEVDHPKAPPVQAEKLPQATECVVPRSQAPKAVTEAEKTQAKSYVGSGDAKVEQDGATVYLDGLSAAQLDDKVLDASLDPGGNVQFALGQQA